MAAEQSNKQAGLPPSPSSDLLGAYYRGSDGAATCALCHYECDWEDCHAGCDDGYFDGYEEDPLLYDPGDLTECPECGGRGGSYWCPNPECETGECWKQIPAPSAPNEKVSDAPDSAAPNRNQSYEKSQD